ncbi:hypothetical protein GY45DRAFT_1346164 [Cubamyces sp. BRFM 1775]|nr:hypothetical protein GY45DRAFT_1346164 [Cubamyces sp. BRFM 1775]
MALALPAPSTLVPISMPPTRSSSIRSTSSSSRSVPDCRIVISAGAPSSAGAQRPDVAPYVVHSPASLSPAESDDVPLSPMVFHPNEDFEKNRLSFYELPPPAASSPSSPQNEMPSPVVFSHPNLSSPTLALLPTETQPQAHPPPVFPLTSSALLEARLKRPLPPLPKVFTYPGDAAAEPRRHRPSELTTSCGGGRGSRAASPSSSDELRDNDSVTVFSASPSPSGASSHSPATSTYTTASSDFPDSSKADCFPRADSLPHPTKPKHLALTIPVRSQSAPLPHADMQRTVVASPHISVTPASPVPPGLYSMKSPGGWKRIRTASETSIVLASDTEDNVEPPKQASAPHPLPVSLPAARSPSPAPSLAPSTSSAKSTTKSSPKSTLRRIASKTKLFGRRTMSTSTSSSDPWTTTGDDDDTIVGHSSASSFDDQTLRGGVRARSESPLGTSERRAVHVIDDSNCCLEKGLLALATPPSSADRVPRAIRRLEIAEVTLTPMGDVWEARELEEVIPKLRQLRAPAKIRI